MEALKDGKLRIADDVANTLYSRDVDVNELSKCVGFVRDNPDGALFFTYLDTVIAEGRTVVRSGRTLIYYRAIRDACRQHLAPYQDDPRAMAEILGWAVRLMRFYAVSDQLGKPVRPPRRTDRAPRTPPPSPGGERQTGMVKRFDASKRYGFIEPDGGGRDAFVHLSQVDGGRPLQAGQRVNFTTEVGPKGLRACDVRLE